MSSLLLIVYIFTVVGSTNAFITRIKFKPIKAFIVAALLAPGIMFGWVIDLLPILISMLKWVAGTYMKLALLLGGSDQEEFQKLYTEAKEREQDH